jgi:hypothetical protein
VNTDVFDRAIGAIEAEPETWRQSSWGLETECGTSYCLAGHVVVQAGYQMDWVGGYLLNTGERFRAASECRLPDGEILPIRWAAMKLLGITVTEADYLFHGGNSLEDLKWMGKAIANGESLANAWTNR